MPVPRLTHLSLPPVWRRKVQLAPRLSSFRVLPWKVNVVVCMVIGRSLFLPVPPGPCGPAHGLGGPRLGRPAAGLSAAPAEGHGTGILSCGFHFFPFLDGEPCSSAWLCQGLCGGPCRVWAPPRVGPAACGPC